MEDNISQIMTSLSSQFGNLIPGVFGALFTLIAGFFIAGIVRRLTQKLIRKTNIDSRISPKVGSAFRLDTFVAKLVYYLVVLLTLMVVLNMLGVTGVLEPLQDMVGKFLGSVPNIVAAGIIGFAGYMLGNIASDATGFVAARFEAYGEKYGIATGDINLSRIVKSLVFLAVFVPILVVALEKLNMTAISEPATAMLGKFMNSIPQIIAAILVFMAFYIVGRFLTTILSGMLRDFGLDNMGDQLGIASMLGDRSISKLVGNIVFFFIVFTGLISASDKLGLVEVQVILRDVFDIAGRVFFGVVIIFAGILISNIAVSALSKSSSNGWTIPIVRFAIMGIFLAFALHTMGIAESIVNLAFGLTLGAIAVAFALSFGLGGREAAGKQMETFFNNIKK